MSKTSDDSDKSRGELEFQLTRNLLTIALNNIGNTGAAAMYFDKSIIARAADNNTGTADNSASPQAELIK